MAIDVQVPVLETPRLKLMGHQVADFDACVTMWADPRVTRFIGGRPFAIEEVWTRLLRYVGHWAMLGYGYWVIRERESGRYCGEVGFADFRRQLDPPLGDTPEIGWALSPDVWHRGYATEAVKACLAWGDRAFPGRHTACLIDLDNAPSIKVATACGYRERIRTSYKGQPTLLFERWPPAGQAEVVTRSGPSTPG